MATIKLLEKFLTILQGYTLEYSLLIRTCKAGLSGGPLSMWYGMTVVRYFGSIPINQHKLKQRKNRYIKGNIQKKLDDHCKNTLD